MRNDISYWNAAHMQEFFLPFEHTSNIRIMARMRGNTPITGEKQREYYNH